LQRTTASGWHWRPFFPVSVEQCTAACQLGSGGEVLPYSGFLAMFDWILFSLLFFPGRSPLLGAGEFSPHPRITKKPAPDHKEKSRRVAVVVALKPQGPAEAVRICWLDSTQEGTCVQFGAKLRVEEQIFSFQNNSQNTLLFYPCSPGGLLLAVF